MDNSLRALIVDDSPDDVELLLLHLRRSGYEVTHQAVDTSEAMRQALEDQTWDVILCDHAMPRFSSGAALALTKEMSLDIPFIIVSGAIGEESAVEAMRAGCHDYVMKNNLARLAPAIQRELREADTRRERKRAEEALRVSQAHLAQVVESLPVVLFSREAETSRLLLIMGAIHEVFGYDREEFLNNPELGLKSIHPDDAQRVAKTFKEGLTDMMPFDLEYRVIHGQRNEPVWVFQHVVPIAGEDGTLSRYDGVILDITEQQKAKQEHDKMQAQLLHAQKLESLGVLAGGIAHDFNNLLTVISGNTQYLGKTLSLTPDQADILKDIETATMNAAEMTRSLQVFSRPTQPQTRTIDANQLIDDVYRLLHRMIPATIDFQLDHDAQACPIEVDPGQMQQVLVNLCVNARDALAGGGLLEIQTQQMGRDALPATVKNQLDSQRCVRIRVADSGTGMSEETRQRVFDPFFTTKPLDRGTGLGLTIVYKIVQAHNGAIDLTSKPGKGTQFDIFFPLTTEAPVDKSKEPVPGARGEERILVVEDEQMVASLLKTVLESRGYSITIAEEPGTAIKLIRAGDPPFDLAILDYSLPQMTGDHCLAECRQTHPDLKAILITGYDVNEEDLVASSCLIVRKPFSVPLIAQTVRQTLDSPSPESA